MRAQHRRFGKSSTCTRGSEKEQIELFSDETEARTLRDEQSRFGDLVYEALFAVGKDNDFYRRLVV